MDSSILLHFVSLGPSQWTSQSIMNHFSFSAYFLFVFPKLRQTEPTLKHFFFDVVLIAMSNNLRCKRWFYMQKVT